MARPLKEGLSYFPHDTDALNDSRIERLVTKFGLVGYGFYFALLERIYAAIPGPYQWNLNENAANFSRKCRLFRKNSERILNFCVECGLFDRVYFLKDSTLTSASIRERADVIIKAREIKRKQRLSSGLSSELSSGLSAVCPPQTKLKVNQTKDKEKNSSSSSLDQECLLNSDEIIEVTKSFEEEVCKITQGIAMELNVLFCEYTKDQFLTAIRACAEQNKHTMAYLKGVLRNLSSDDQAQTEQLLPGMSLERVIAIAEGRFDATKPNYRRAVEVLNKRGIPFKARAPP